MKTFSIIFCLLFILLSYIKCNESVQKSFIKPQIKGFYYQKSCNGNICGFDHFVTLDSYYETFFDDYNFVQLADKYLDTVTSNLNVRSVTFVKPFNFNPSYDSKDFNSINSNAIISFVYFINNGEIDKIPPISMIKIWENGKYKTIDNINWNNRYTK